MRHPGFHVQRSFPEPVRDKRFVVEDLRVIDLDALEIARFSGRGIRDFPLNAGIAVDTVRFSREMLILRRDVIAQGLRLFAAQFPVQVCSVRVYPPRSPF